MNKLVAIAKLTRIEHSIMLIIAVLAAELIAGGLPSLQIVLLSLVSAIFVSAGAFAINDYFDVAADRANGLKNRPIVAGAISKRGAFGVAIACFVIGILASAPINVYVLTIAVIFSVLDYLYSYKMKDIAVLGNAYVALGMALPFVFGTFVVTTAIPPSIIFIFFIIFLSGVAREIHGAIRDKEGDMKARRSRNIVYKIGVKKSAQLAFILYAEAIALSEFLFVFRAPFAYNLVYIIPITIVNIALFYVAAGYYAKPTKEFFKRSRNISLGAMALALISYLIAAIYFLPI